MKLHIWFFLPVPVLNIDIKSICTYRTGINSYFHNNLHEKALFFNLLIYVKTSTIFQIHFWFILHNFIRNIKRNKLFQSRESLITQQECDTIILVIELYRVKSATFQHFKILTNFIRMSNWSQLSTVFLANLFHSISGMHVHLACV